MLLLKKVIKINFEHIEITLFISPFWSINHKEGFYNGKTINKSKQNIYQICREECELTRERANEMMTDVSASRIEKIEYNLQDPTPYDIVQMADCYKRPNECYDNFIKNTFCRILFLT